MTSTVQVHTFFTGLSLIISIFYELKCIYYTSLLIFKINLHYYRNNYPGDAKLSINSLLLSLSHLSSSYKHHTKILFFSLLYRVLLFSFFSSLSPVVFPLPRLQVVEQLFFFYSYRPDFEVITQDVSVHRDLQLNSWSV